MENFHKIKNLITRKTCRVCNHDDLELIISLNEQYVVNFTESGDEKIFKAPYELVFCNKKSDGCGLLQLKHTVPGEILYKKFWYKSGINKTMIDALTDISSRAEKLVKLDTDDIIIDIGANDGTLLRSYNSKNIRLVGFEPATNLVKDAQVKTTKIINDFFNYESFNREFPNQKAKIITSIAMFYDLEAPNKFVNDIVNALDKNGIWIVQMNYLASMLENNAFDNIVHEHLEYYSLSTMQYLIQKHNLEIFDVELNEINGGSFRIYIKHKDCKQYQRSKNVDELLNYEKKIGLNNNDIYHKFAKRINELKQITCDFIKKEVSKGKKIYIYGASTRGMTLLQYYNLDNSLITAAADRNPAKWGKKIVGTEIPIISEEQARKEKPDYFLVLPWYFIKEFRLREKDYLKNGGKFLVPLPQFHIIDTR